LPIFLKIVYLHPERNGPVAQLNTCLPAGREQQQKSMIIVYIIRSELDGRFYVGMTCDLERRLMEHNSKRNFSTKGYTPWKLFFYETYENRIDARKREKYLKSGVGKEYIKNRWSGSSAE
jgi:putative endonuclease